MNNPHLIAAFRESASLKVSLTVSDCPNRLALTSLGLTETTSSSVVAKGTNLAIAKNFSSRKEALMSGKDFRELASEAADLGLFM